jgi:pimeloyl-ACP methyl ester carboxylesterase
MTDEAATHGSAEHDGAFSSPQAADMVVVVHGLGSKPAMMTALAWRLQRRGYRVTNWGYRSLFGSIEKHGARLSRDLLVLAADPSIERLNLVTHSMGGIVARYALSLAPVPKLHRMVMLAPPNRGSRMASFFEPWLGQILRPIEQLSTRPESFVNCLALPEGVEVGVIAAKADHLVQQSSTHLDCQRDHIAFRATHTALIFRRDVAEQVKAFLANGRFDRTPADVVQKRG